MSAATVVAGVLVAYCWAFAAVALFLIICAVVSDWRARRRQRRLRAEKFDPIRNWRGGRL